MDKWDRVRSRFIRVWRAKNHCQVCGVKMGEKNPATGSKVVLRAIQVDPRRPKSIWNLMAMCQRCHLNHDRKENITKRKYGKRYKVNQGLLVGI